MAINVHIESRKLIKPDIPTPPSLRNYKIGFTDELAPIMDVCIVLFFFVKRDNNPQFVARLEKSLEKTLTRLYPLAGRYVQELRYIDCDDHGAEFICSKVDMKLQDILDSEWDAKVMDKLIPSMPRDSDKITDPILSTQVTTFQCGGIALGVSISHRIADASTLCTFLNEWAAMTREDKEVKLTGAGFNTSSLFPGRGESPISVTSPNVVRRNIVTKKFSFTEARIINMKAQFGVNEKNGNHHLSKVQLVSAIIWTAFNSVNRAISNYRRDSFLAQALNLRERTASLIPKNSCGNLVVPFATISRNDETTQDLAYLLSDSVKEVISNYSKLRHETEEGQTMVVNSWSLAKNSFAKEDLVYCVSSWCKFPFYEADFGFGKPVWVTTGSKDAKNMVYLIDGTESNGVDAYVCLEDKDVPNFEEALNMNAFSI